MTSVAQKNAATNDFPDQPKARNDAAISSAVSELDGRIDDADPLAAALALAAQGQPGEDGTFSYQASSWPQLMQAEPGLTIDRFRGTRAATTFRKLPIARPGMNTTAERANATRQPS